MTKVVGVLTSGGDCPGLNAAIRGLGKAGMETFDLRLIGFRDGFRGLMQDRTMPLDREHLSNILTLGGTILGTSRDKPHRMPVGNQVLDMTDVMVETYRRHHLEALVCLGGGGTQKNAKRLMDKGLNIITLPKTIDNDVARTDVTFGFDTALGIATDAIDKLHSTATSHNRVIVVEIMGHQAGWLALGAGLAGGADAILIPEIPYDIHKVAEAICFRTRLGKRFSIVAVAEGALSVEQAVEAERRIEKEKKVKARKGKKGKPLSVQPEFTDQSHTGNTLKLTQQLEKLTGLESRLTILGHLLRGGTPSAADRLLATRLGTRSAELIDQRHYGVMVASRGDRAEPVSLDEVAGFRKTVPLDHAWLQSARQLGVCFGD